MIRNQYRDLRRSIRGLEREGFRHIYILDKPEDIEAAIVERHPLQNNRKCDHGPFDTIGDVHGCFDELAALLSRLGYRVSHTGSNTCVIPPAGRKTVFLGDLVDRSPKIVPVLKLVMNMVEAGSALCVPGNHDMKLLHKLRGKDVHVTHGLAETLRQLQAESDEFRGKVASFRRTTHCFSISGKRICVYSGFAHLLRAGICYTLIELPLLI